MVWPKKKGWFPVTWSYSLDLASRIFFYFIIIIFFFCLPPRRACNQLSSFLIFLILFNFILIFILQFPLRQPFLITWITSPQSKYFGGREGGKKAALLEELGPEIFQGAEKKKRGWKSLILAINCRCIEKYPQIERHC